ncbi:MAG: ABC transporter permease [Marinibacterium sp.]|nr:ABC transporter permease [Marinibacterium sp.]
MMRFFAAMADALTRLFADKGARMTMVGSILIYACLYPQPYVGEVVRDIPIAVIDQDGSTASREFLRRLDSSDSVAIAAVADGMPEATDLYYAREVYGIVLIPPQFERDLLAGRQAPVAAFGDGSYFVLYGGLASAVNQVAQSLGAQVRLSRLTAMGVDQATATALVAPIDIASVPLFNPNGGYASYLVPAAFVLIIQQTLLMGIGIMHAGRPTRPGVPRLATPAAYILLYMVLIGATQIVLPWVYGLPQLGSPLTLFALALPFLIAVTAMGFALLQVINTREGVVFFLVVQGMPLFFVSGVAWPLESVAEPMRSLMLLFPSSSAVLAFTRVDQMGADLYQIMPVIRLQGMLALGYGVLAVLLHRWRHPNAG